MSELEEFRLEVGKDGARMTLSLYRKPNPGKIPVLLLHGLSANHGTFLAPRVAPTGVQRCLMGCLYEGLDERRFEPWLLDWRGNGRIAETDLERLREKIDFDAAAQYDIPAALDKILEVSRPTRICALGHCMGAAALAQSIAGGHVGPAKGLSHVVLLTIGLFYEPAWDGRLKSQDHSLERLWLEGGALAIDPRSSRWPTELDEIYRNWPTALRPHREPRSRMDQICNRLSFLFGLPYREQNLPREVHRGHFLEEQFGAIPLRMYVHAGRNIRRGWAAPFEAPNDDGELVGAEAWKHFAALDRVTLIAGARNQIWHRESIDRMYEWLRRGGTGHDGFRREVLPDYAHQDLLWGSRAYLDVFPKIFDGLPATDSVRHRRERDDQPVVTPGESLRHGRSDR